MVGMNRNEIVERIGLRLKRAGVNPVVRNSITMMVMEEFKDILNEQLDAEMEGVLLTLHDEYGFGKKRLNEFMEKLQTRIDDYYDSYSTDTLIKFQIMLRERGIEYKTTLDQKKEKRNG